MTDQPDEQKKPKIIIDENWKARVQAEKEAMGQEPGAEQAEEPRQTGQPDADEQVDTAEDIGPMPPASLSFLITTLATQTMVAMGLVPNPLTKKAERRLDQAKHFIDTLQVLQEKTEGNRTPEESQILDGILHDLRMGFISVKQQPAGQEPAAGSEQQSSSGETSRPISPDS